MPMIAPDFKRLAVKSTRLLFLLLLCSGCATHPEGLMQPLTTAAPMAQPVEMLVITNRIPSDDPAILFTTQRDAQLHLERVVVLIPPESNRKVGQIQWPKHTIPNPNTDFAISAVAPLDEAQARQWFNKAGATNGGHLLIFVHGYNTSFDDGVYLFAQIIHDSKMQVAPLLFSWPSKGDVLAYDYDRESATYSRTALSDLIEQAVASEDVHEITILSHSMGAWITMESLRTLSLKGVDTRGKLRNVILASPDIDVNVFHAQYKDLSQNRPLITLIVSRNDKALRLARIIGGNMDRLGSIDLTKEPYLSNVDPLNIQIIDISTVDENDRSSHLKFSESPAIVKLIGASLVGGQALSHDEKTLFETLGIIIIKQENNVLKIIRKEP